MGNSEIIKTKVEKIIVLKYHLDIIKLLEDNDIKYEIIN